MRELNEETETRVRTKRKKPNKSGILHRCFQFLTGLGPSLTKFYPNVRESESKWMTDTDNECFSWLTAEQKSNGARQYRDAP